YYLSQMQNDLISDSLFLSQIAEDLENRLPVIQALLEELHKENNQESFNKVFREYVNTIFVPLYFVSNKATYNEMESSAKLGIIRDKELRNKIVALYNHLEITKNIFSVNYEFMQPVDADLIYGKGIAKYQKNQDRLFLPYISEGEIYKFKDLRFELESNAANWNWTIVDMQPAVESQLKELGIVLARINTYLNEAKFAFYF
ncbi:MAG: hypothetical protein JW857_09455, partial [Bacteroidales bacterium]|nr:hypothetical protein [Bacteroidales bacterium]